MEVVKADAVPKTFDGARLLEKRGDLVNAIELYELLLGKSPNDLKIIHRLIILYRKNSTFRKELRMIDRAIKIYTNQYSLPKSTARQITVISRKLNISLGHTDKKGKPLMLPAEVEKLQKRRLTVQKKLQK